MNRLTAVFFAALFLLSGCLPANLPQQPSGTQAGQDLTPIPTPAAGPVETPASGRLSLDLLKNFTYGLGDFNTQAAHKDGVYSDDRLQSRLVEPAAFGDLNSDGQQDAAVILAVKTGGTGTFYNLTAVLDQSGTPVQAGFAYIGDRQIVNHLDIVNGRVVLDYLTQSLRDPLCCPSEHRLRSYLLENGELRLASEQVLDSPTAQATALPNAILIDQPVTADQLTTPMQVRGRVSQVPTDKKLAYYVTDFNTTLLMQGEVNLEGEPGGPGAFAFEFTVDPASPGLIQVEIVDSADGILRGRSTVVLITQ